MSIVPIDGHSQPVDRTADDAYDRLTDKQRAFVDFYTHQSRGNGTDAARRAGFAVPRQEAYRLMQHRDVRACISARARTAMSEYETVDELAAFIRHGVSHPIERSAWVKAVETMLKYHGVLSDKIEHSGKVQQDVRQIVITYASSNEDELGS